MGAVCLCRTSDPINYVITATPTTCTCSPGAYTGLDCAASLAVCTSNNCSICSSALTFCLFCVDSNASPDASGVCVCNTGFVSDGLSPFTCVKCNAVCATCDTSGHCLTCTARNAVAQAGALASCVCDPGYYGVAPLSSYTSCTACTVGCATCDSTDSCLTCVARYAAVSSGSECYCMDGYYAESTPLITEFSCLACNSDCKTCSGPDICETCNLMYANPGAVRGCGCPENSAESEGKCVCSSPYVMSAGAPHSCGVCYETCSECTSTAENACTKCLDSTLELVNGACVCKSNSYWTGSTCKDCGAVCSGCTSYEVCIDCAYTSYEKNATGNCNPKCSSGFYAYLGDCLQCGNLCLTCTSTACTQCVNNANTVNSQCICNYGYSGATACDRTYFEALLSVSLKNIVTVSLSSALNQSLLASNFNVSIASTVDLSYVFTAVNTTTYTFQILPVSTISESTEVYVTISPQGIVSSLGELLKNYELAGKLHYYFAIQTSYMALAAVNSTKALAKTAIAASVAAGVMSNPSCLWVLMNTLEIITYLPLNKLPYSQALMQFFTTLSGINIIPNPAEYLITTGNDSLPYEQAGNYGFNTSLFLFNAGPWIANIFIFMALVPLFYFGSKIKFGSIAIKCAKLLLNYRYSFFLRSWTQSYLSIGLLALIQMHSVRDI